MNREDILLASAVPDSYFKTNTTFTQKVMANLHKPETFASQLRKTNTPPKRNVFMKLRQLPATALVLVALASFATLGGAVYAAVKFAPDLIEIIDKSINKQGHTEYSVPAFAQCAPESLIQIKNFQLAKDAPNLSDDEVKKILQAKCELRWLEKFVRDTWPAYGTHKEWQNGDDIFYTRVDVLGALQSASPNTVTLSHDYGYDGEKKTIEYARYGSEEIKAFTTGKEISLNDIKQGDTVFSVLRVTEKYYQPRNGQDTNATPLGIVGVIKLNLPAKYYGGMQNYLIEVPQCIGNSDEVCPEVVGPHIYPENLEAMREWEDFHEGYYITRLISGEVTKIDGDSLIIKSRSNKLYHVALPAGSVAKYNTELAPKAQQALGSNTTLTLGSTVQAIYYQPKGADPTQIASDHIVSLRLGMNIDAKEIMRKY